MSLRYLVGPVSPARAREWDAHRSQGRCLAFHSQDGADLTIAPSDSCESVLARLPADWRPDFILLDLDYRMVPACLWHAPVPLVALAPDWQLQWSFLRRFLPLTQRVLTDTAGVEVMRKEGIHHARQANLFGLQGIFRQPAPEHPPNRDIDILFVGNMHHAVQRHRQRWLGRLARLAGKWRVVITQGVRGEEYRQLLLRSRIVFNRSIRGEWNLRVGEACSCGALLFNETGNLELPLAWTHDEDCVFYDEDNLEALLDHYLQHEDQRHAVAAAGQANIQRYTFSAMWEEALAQIEHDWPEIQERHRLAVSEATPPPTPPRSGEGSQNPLLPLSASGRGLGGGVLATLLTRTAQAFCAADGRDTTLAADLDTALAEQNDPALHSARGSVEALYGHDAQGGLSPELLRSVAGRFHRAAVHPGGGPLAALNLVEILLALGQKQLALDGARRLLSQLDEPVTVQSLDLPHFPPRYDFFRVEWENAAWQNAGAPAREVRDKLALLRWRLHALLGEMTRDVLHWHEAALARPDLPTTRAALGCALGEAKRPAEAVPHLRFAVESDPFDRAAARALYQALIDAGKPAQAEAFKEERLLLHRAAPTVMPVDDWLMRLRVPHPPAPSPKEGEGEKDTLAPLSLLGRGVGGEGRAGEGRAGEGVSRLEGEGISADEPIIVGTCKVSVCIIARNEEGNLPGCLDSVAGLGGDTIVCDTGSTDRTREIARERGAKVIDFPWVDSFSAARNACLEHATGEFIFWLDADDRIDEANRDKLRKLFASLPAKNVAFSMKCRCLPDPITGTATTVDHMRLFLNHPLIRWRYRVHEQILGAIHATGGEICFTGIVIQHTGYLDPALRRRKLQRDLRLLEMEYAEQPHDPFTLFNLGATYAEMGRHDEALPFLQESLDRSHPRDSIVRKLYSLKAGCHLNRRRLPAALQACLQGQAVCPDDQELLFLEGTIRTDQGDLHGARAALIRLLGMEDNPHFASVADGLRGFKGRHQLAVVCFRLGETSEAELLWQAVLRERPDFVPAHLGLGELYLSLKRWPELEDQALALAKMPHGELEAVLLRARAHMARQEYTAARSLLTESLKRWPDALPLWVTLSHALLQEDRDHAEAERVLREILLREPGNVQGRQNLEVLRRRTGRSGQAAD
jgi:tetratricopeptide (TPR) repeat protein